MVKFPTWVGSHKSKDKMRLARRRLKYLLMRAAAELNESGSIASLSQTTGVAREVIYYSMNHGGFSPNVAQQIEEAVGRELLPKTWLIYPLDIASE